MLQLLATPQFKKDLRKIPFGVIKQTDHVISHLRTNPFNPRFNIKKLVNTKLAMWRLRIGSYRLIYSFDKTNLILHRFCHRKDIYRNF